MIRPKLLSAVLAVAALTLSACGSTSGTPTAQDSTFASSAASTSTSSASESSAADVTAPESSDVTDSAASDATTTVGDGTLDAQSTQWFTTACTGLQPMGDMLATVLGIGMGAAMATGTAAAGSPSPADMQSKLAAALTSAGTALSDTEAKLQATPPPTFAKGGEMASAFLTFLKKTGPKLADAGKQVAATPVTDAASLQTALSKIQTLGGDDLGGADPLSGYDLDPATEKAIETIPACKTMQDSLGGLMSMGSAG
ncbi:MAG: hypothetical protein ABI034_01985 [Nakamurella sp.]